MVKSLFTGVTGLKSHQQRMDMIGNNIANVNTIGFKTDVMTFADVYYQTKRNPSAPTATLGGINPRQVGYGVKVSSVEANLSQSGFNYTDSKTDVALDGKGFFQLMDGAGNIFYTRAGHFKFDEAGYLVNDDGFHVLGVTGECDGVAASSDIIRAIIPQTSNTVSSATKLVNGTNVTVSVSAPSDYTNMSVAFKDADFPFASYANGILTIFFDQDQQFESATDFDNEIQKALTAGGVSLPDDVELSVEFDPIPDDVNSKAAKNTVSDFKFSTTDATCRFHISRPSSTGGKDHAYIDFSVQDNTVTDNVSLRYGGQKGAVKVAYDPTLGWTITIFDDTTSSDINTALNIFLSADENSQVPKMTCSAFQIPTGFANRQDAIKALCGQAITDGTIDTSEIIASTLKEKVQQFEADGVTPSKDADGNFIYTYETVTEEVEVDDGAGNVTTETRDVTASGRNLFGVQSSGGVTGNFDFAVKENGSFGNNYTITFARKSGYGNTSATWEENNLTINVCADTTIADVNEQIKAASGGDAKRIITFYDIGGLDYGEPTRIQEIDGSVTWEYALGYSYNTGTKKWTDRNNNDATEDEVRKAFNIDATKPVPVPVADSVASTITISKKDATGADPDRVVWNVATRDKYFGGNPQVRPTDGDDSFYTKTAKSLSTFNLTDGRIGEEQSMGKMTDYMIGSDGVIIGLHPVYGTMVLGRVDIATFDNPNGLEKVGGTNFRATVASGPAIIARPGEDGAGAIVPNALEMSNVDLADEFTNMITTQRGYQANSRVITVSDTMIEELLSLKR